MYDGMYDWCRMCMMVNSVKVNDYVGCV